MSKILGIDYGRRRIGLAVSDENGKVAFPYLIIENNSEATAVLVALIKKEAVGGVVMGESLDEHGAENPVMGGARAFGLRLKEETGLQIIFEPEFMTSVEAHRSAFEEQEKKGRPEVDASAAALILQRYLDRVARGV